MPGEECSVITWIQFISIPLISFSNPVKHYISISLEVPLLLLQVYLLLYSILLVVTHNKGMKNRLRRLIHKSDWCISRWILNNLFFICIYLVPLLCHSQSHLVEQVWVGKWIKWHKIGQLKIIMGLLTPMVNPHIVWAIAYINDLSSLENHVSHKLITKDFIQPYPCASIRYCLCSSTMLFSTQSIDSPVDSISFTFLIFFFKDLVNITQLLQLRDQPPLLPHSKMLTIALGAQDTWM